MNLLAYIKGIYYLITYKIKHGKKKDGENYLEPFTEQARKNIKEDYSFCSYHIVMHKIFSLFMSDEIIKENENLTDDEFENLKESKICPIRDMVFLIIKVWLNHNQWAALICLIYEIGEDNFYYSHLPKLINDKRSIDKIEKEFLKCKHHDKKILEEMKAKRKKLFDLYCSKEFTYTLQDEDLNDIDLRDEDLSDEPI